MHTELPRSDRDSCQIDNMASVMNADNNDKKAFWLYPMTCIHRNKYFISVCLAIV